MTELTQPLTDDEIHDLADLRPGEPYPPAIMERYRLSPFRNLEPALVATCIRLMEQRDGAILARLAGAPVGGNA